MAYIDITVMRKSVEAYMQLLTIIHNHNILSDFELKPGCDFEKFSIYYETGDGDTNEIRLRVTDWFGAITSPTMLYFETKEEAEASLTEHKQLWLDYYGIE